MQFIMRANRQGDEAFLENHLTLSSENMMQTNSNVRKYTSTNRPCFRLSVPPLICNNLAVMTTAIGYERKE